jgi:glycosyltransferase 2 family protein
VKDGGRGGTSGGSLKLFLRIGSLVFVALCVAFAVHLLVHDWPQTKDALRNAHLWWLAPAALCAVGGMLLMAWRWRAAIAAVGGGSLGRHRVISAFFVGETGKYIPGAIWATLGRGELARREGYKRSIAYSSVALSLIGCYLAAACTALVLAIVSLVGGSLSPSWWPVAVVAVVGVTAIHPAVSRRILGFVGRITKRTFTVDLPSWSESLRLTGTYVPVWVLIAAATTLITRSLVAHPPIARVALAAIVSWIIGFVTPSPGGIGVREAVFVAGAGIAAGPAAGVAILARVLFVLVDITGAGIGWLVLRLSEPTGVLAATRGPTI